MISCQLHLSFEPSCRHIKATSPKLMMVAILGFTSVLPASIIQGLTLSRLQYDISETLTTALCIVRSIAWSLYVWSTKWEGWGVCSDHLCDIFFVLQLEPVVTNSGFTLAVGIFVLKNWRIYRIFHNPKNVMVSIIIMYVLEFLS